MEANDSIEIPDAYPDKFIAIDLETNHQYILEFIDFVFDSEKGKPVGNYKVSISKRGRETN